MTEDEKALKAAETIRNYCKSRDNECNGCVFNCGYMNQYYCCRCSLSDPNHLPETWQLEELKQQ